ncbi:MAG: flagellar hook-basal body complex protein, partial [Fretibacterium sp.]|nr:flagellar hook-basal body complex protein [Fretibacterium sp.]
MLRSLMTAVTGVRAHQTMLDVTGNNIANANTTGFKKDNTIFQDLMYQNSKLASAPSDGRGGINPAQVGLGVSVGAIETIFTQGGANYTGNVSDMMINGNGFFVYDSGTGTQLYSRAGANVRDADNNLVQSGTGYRLQGYKMEKSPLDSSTYVQSSSIQDINIPLGRKLEPNATSVVQYQCNLDSRSTAYLPYGFADIPYNQDALTDKSPAVFGYTGNRYGTAEVKLGSDKTYFMSFETNLDNTETLVSNGTATVVPADTTATPPIPAGYVKDYLSINIGTGQNMATATSINFDMTGITTGGLPELKLTSDVAGNANLKSVSTDGKYSLYQYPGTAGMADTDYFIATYDAGVLTIRNATGVVDATGALIPNDTTPITTANVGSEKILQYNVEDKMNYAGARATVMRETATTGVFTAETVQIAVEFDERQLWDDTTTMYMWYRIPAGTYNTDPDDPTATVTITDDTMVKMTATVYFNPDGTFSDVGGLAVVAPTDVDYLSALGQGSFKIEPGNSGASLVFSQVENSAEVTIGTITQGSGV